MNLILLVSQFRAIQLDDAVYSTAISIVLKPIGALAVQWHQLG